MDLLKDTLTPGKPVHIILPVLDQAGERFATWLTQHFFRVERTATDNGTYVNGICTNNDDNLAGAMSNLLEQYEDHRALLTVMTDALEGSAISYWAEAKDAAKLLGGTTIHSFYVRDGGYENDRIHDEWKLVDAITIKAAVQRILLGDFPVRRDLAQQFVGKPRDWDYDDEGLDVLMQAICFNQVEYG